MLKYTHAAYKAQRTEMFSATLEYYLQLAKHNQDAELRQRENRGHQEGFEVGLTPTNDYMTENLVIQTGLPVDKHREILQSKG